MITCLECGADAPDGAKFCSQCGKALPAAPPVISEPDAEVLGSFAENSTWKRRGGRDPVDWRAIAPYGGIAAIILIIVAAIGARSSPAPVPVGTEVDAATAAMNASMEADNAMNAALAAADLATNAAVAPDEASGSSWVYTTFKDEMTDKASSIARLSSENSIEQGSPYGTSDLSVSVRKHPRMGTDVYFTLGSGQLLCPSYEGCTALVRFDDGEPQRLSMLGSSDNSSDVVFAEGAASLLAKIKASKRMVVALEIYQAGSPNFTFKTDGLKWPPET